jgi:hypothetical protein
MITKVTTTKYSVDNTYKHKNEYVFLNGIKSAVLLIKHVRMNIFVKIIKSFYYVFIRPFGSILNTHERIVGNYLYQSNLGYTNLDLTYTFRYKVWKVTVWKVNKTFREAIERLDKEN